MILGGTELWPSLHVLYGTAVDGVPRHTHKGCAMGVAFFLPLTYSVELLFWAVGF